MKILYITIGDHMDYQNDSALIGLKELFGADVVDVNKQHHNYDTYDADLAKTMYGKGMTVTRVLQDLPVDRTDIKNKIKTKYFDYIVYGSIWRCSSYINEVLSYYDPSKVIIIDGEDETNINNTFNLGTHYFKRELIHKNDRLKPISFAIPTSKVNFNKDKKKDRAFITPQDTSTYIYDNEDDYYNDYNEARFGITTKKHGWDCMRHYEILANGCIPHFLDIDSCPELIMHNFPKSLCKEVNQLLKSTSPQDVYDEYAEKFEQHLLNNNTTKQLATYIIDAVKE
ncbi:hypothetical protein N9Z65_00805 [bacterium]|nr:hypothetical protein [bacterium]